LIKKEISDFLAHPPPPAPSPKLHRPSDCNRSED
jgi:hypothetical protein